MHFVLDLPDEQTLNLSLMSREEQCKRFGLPVGSLWVDQDAVRQSQIHPLFDPNRKKISWDELPSNLGDHPLIPDPYGGMTKASGSVSSDTMMQWIC
eukprot:1783439-Rhodomonas_salina.1